MLSAILIKLCHGARNFLRHILKSKQPRQFTSAHAQMTYIENQSKFIYQKSKAKRKAPSYLRL